MDKSCSMVMTPSPTLAAFGREHGATSLQPLEVLVALEDARAMCIRHLQVVRLRLLDEQPHRKTSKSVLRLVTVVDRSPVSSSAALTSGRVLVHPWVLEHLHVFDGCAVAIECEKEPSTLPTPETAVVLVSVQDKHPASLAVDVAPPPSVAAQPRDQLVGPKATEAAVVSHVGLLPECIRTGKLGLERAVLRQLRAVFGHELSARALRPRQLLAVRVLQELYVLRVETVRLRPQEVGGVPIAIEVAGLGSLSAQSKPGLGAQDSLENTVQEVSERFEEQLESRLRAQGFAGYSDVVRDVLLHLALVLNADAPASIDGEQSGDLQRMGSHGLVLSGVHGVGKSLCLKAIEKELVREGVTTWRVDAMSLLMDLENAKKATAYEYLSDKLDELLFASTELSASPSRVVVLIDDLETLFQSTDGQGVDEDTQAQHLPPLGSSLLRLLDDLTARRSHVVVVGASANAETEIPAAAQRAGRFGKTIELIVPTEAMRRDMLQVHLQQLRVDSDKQVHADDNSVAATFASRMAALTGGYIAKDLVRICRNAAVIGFSRASSGSGDQREEIAVTWTDLVVAQQAIKPSQLRELNVSAPGTAGSMDFVGYHDVRKQLFEFVSWKFHPTAAVQRLGVGNTSGILLFGPSGCGKSLLVKELTAQAKVNCVSVKSSELVSKYFGDSEKAIRQLFARARKAAPCLLFFDEFDAVAHKRSFDKGDGDGDAGGGVYARILSTFLNELDGVGAAGKTAMDGVLVVAATNRKDALDAALIRPGRIDKALELGYPSQSDVQEILEHYTSRMPLAPDVDLAGLAATERASHRPISGADISAVCKEAAFRALREDLDAREVRMRHFQAAWAHRLNEPIV